MRKVIEGHPSRQNQEPTKEFASAEVFRESLEALMKSYFGEDWMKVRRVIEDLVSVRKRLMRLSDSVASIEKLGEDVRTAIHLTTNIDAYDDAYSDMGARIMDCLVIS